MGSGSAQVSGNAATKIKTAVLRVLNEPLDGLGPRYRARLSPVPGFWAQITGNAGTFGTPLHYSWSELCEDGSGGQMVKTGGRSGTTSTNFAINEYELYGQPIAPIAYATPVWMQITFDASAAPNFRFSMLQLPALTTGQGWYGTYISGAVTVAADFIRAT